MTDIPPKDRFLRYSKRIHIIEKDGKTTIASSNFLLRKEREEEYLSGAWYEFLEPSTREDCLQKATTFMMQNMGFKKINGAFSIHNVADILAKSDESVKYIVRHIGGGHAKSGIWPQPSTLHNAEEIADTVTDVLIVK